MARVSIVLPAYKRRFLREAIASILAQTYRDYELVVVDDCSPEDLKSVVDGFHDERLSYHRNDENIGGKDLVAAWEKAMEYASGEWCVLASDDDVYLPHCLEAMTELQAKYPTCDLIHARNAVIDGNGAMTSLANVRREFESQILFSQVRVRDRDQRAPDFMFRISALRRIGGFVRFPLAWHSDDATWMLLAKNGCAHTRDVQFCFRESGLGLTSHSDATARQKVQAGEMFRAWYGKFVAALGDPATIEERFALERILTVGNCQISHLEDLVIDHISSSRLWWSVVAELPRTAFGKRELFYRRYPRLRALRELLPFHL